MNAGELRELDVAALSVDELEQAMRAALKLDARELAVAFARPAFASRSTPAEPDRYPLYATAITGASAIAATRQGGGTGRAGRTVRRRAQRRPAGPSSSA